MESPRARRALARALAACLLTAGARAQEPPPPPAEAPAYFEEPADWRFAWGTDTGFALAGLEDGSTNETNDGSTNFDTLWLRLYGRLEYGDQLELVADVFSADGRTPELFGLYARLQPRPWLGLRLGLIPLVVGAWQDRAYPSRQPLIGAPLQDQYLLALRNDSLPASADELLSQRGRGRAATFSLGYPGSGGATTLFYEHCWDTGLEVFGQLGRLRYRAALMEGTPGSPATKLRSQKNGLTPEARLTYRLADGLRLGVSWARGPYLRDDLQPFLPAGRGTRDFHQELVGADGHLERGRLTLDVEWARNRYDSPWVAERLGSEAWTAEAGLRLASGLEAAGRWSRLDHGVLRDGRGAPVDWEADAQRWEAGLVYRFLDRHLALKAAWQRSEVELAPRRVEELAALQLSFAY